jgi:molybdopterin-biosynthesis enzyme MoeA-like protein
MITNQKIDVGDAQYSRLSQTLSFTVAANVDAIKTIEDICGKTNMSMEEVAHEMGKLLESALVINYTRGGARVKY